MTHTGGFKASLSWYFGPGQASFEKSLFGGMLERAALLAQGSAPCPKCKGSGFVVGIDSPAKVRVSTPRVDLLLGLINDTGDGLAVREAVIPLAAPGEATRICRMCAGKCTITRHHPRRKPGMMRIRPQTNEPSYTPNDEVITAFAEHSRRLRKIPSRLVEVLGRYHGDIGAMWESWSRFGRIVSVYPMTEPAQTLVRAALKRAPELSELRTDKVIGILLEKEASGSLPDRARLIRAADDEARVLVEQAHSAWKSEGGRLQ